MYRLVEPVIDEIVAVLEADLHTRLAALQAVAVPVIVLEDPAEITHGEKQNYVMPAIAVIPGRSPFVDDRFNSMDFRHRIVIGIHVEQPDEELLTRKLERYAACVLQTLGDRRAGAGFTTCTLQFATEQPAAIDWGAVRVNKLSLFQRDVFIEIVADAGDSRT